MEANLYPLACTGLIVAAILFALVFWLRDQVLKLRAELNDLQDAVDKKHTNLDSEMNTIKGVLNTRNANPGMFNRWQ